MLYVTYCWKITPCPYAASSSRSKFISVHVSSMLLQNLSCLLASVKGIVVAGNTQVYYNIQIIKDVITRWNNHLSTVNVVPMIVCTTSTDKQVPQRPALKRSWYPIQKKASASYWTTERCEAKNATRLDTILACKINLTKAVHLLQAK